MNTDRQRNIVLAVLVLILSILACSTQPEKRKNLGPIKPHVTADYSSPMRPKK